MSVTSTSRGKPYSVNWPADSTTAIANGISFTIGTNVTPLNSMPVGNVRLVEFDSSTTADFTLTGLDGTSAVISETITATASTPVSSVNEYSSILSILPISGTAGTLNVGYTTGQLMPFTADIWNKRNAYSIAVTNVSGTISVTPYYSLNRGVYNANSFFEFEIAQTQYTYSPTGLTLPFTTNGIISICNNPLVTIANVVTSTTGSFTLSILQQGAAY